MMNNFLKKIGKKAISAAYGLSFTDRFIINPNQKWEVCIIFDACRYDLFKKYNILDGNLEKVYSPGSSTIEWFSKSFKGRYYPDVTYISANPMVSNVLVKKRNGTLPFKKIIDLWKEGWSDEKGTVMPSIVNEVAQNIIDQSEDKVIVHYLQPHYPFIGRCNLLNENMKNFRERIWKKNEKDDYQSSPWAEAKKGTIDFRRLIKAYESNVEFIFKETREFISGLSKNVYVTSDHGNSYGTFGAYGHPSNFHIPETIEVPLLKILQ
jgi:hypothetical protein